MASFYCFYVLIGILLTAVNSLKPAAAPFESIEAAQKWVDAKNAAEMEYWNGRCMFDNWCAEIVDPSVKFVFDGVVFDYQGARAEAERVRKNVVSLESITCQVQEIYGMTVRVACETVSRWRMPVLGSRSVTIDTDQTFEFNKRGLIVHAVRKSRTNKMMAVMRTLAAAVTMPPAATKNQNSNKP